MKFRVRDMARAKQRLYAARAAAHDESLDNLSIILSPHDPNELWIIKNAS